MPSPVVIRRLREGDLEAVLDMVDDVAREGRWIGLESPIDRERLHERMASLIPDADSCQLVAEVGSALAGNLGVWRAREGVGEIGMSVAVPFRRKGVGAALLGAAVDWACQTGLHKLQLEVFPNNEAAIALYRRFAFEEEGFRRRHYRRRNGELWDAILMARHFD